MRRPLASLSALAALAFLLSLGSVVNAQVRGRSAAVTKTRASATKTTLRKSGTSKISKAGKSTRPATRLRTTMPKRVGEGFFSRVYRSRDGVWVIKKMRPAIAGVEPVSKAQRNTMAKTTVRVSEAFRKAGLPVPQSYIPEGKSGVIVQKYSTGLAFEQLEGKAKFEANKNQMKFFGEAGRAAKLIKGHQEQWYIDKNRDNLLFDKTGKITSWIDPVVPTKGAAVQKAIDKLRAQAP